MNIETDLKKDGITIIEPLDKSSVLSVAESVSKKLSTIFSAYGFKYENLYKKLSKVPIYIANIPSGMSEASYFYKNSSIYIRDGMGFDDLEKYILHEYIHYLQEVKDKNGNLLRLGLCEFKGSKIKGMALNEASVQILASNALNETFDTVEYYGLTFSTISQNVYPLLCNLVTQMAYVTGENILFDSTFNSNDYFKNKFVALCGFKTYNKISSNLDKLLEIEEYIIKLNNELQTNDMTSSKCEKIMNKIDNLKIEIKKLYFTTQELIITSYFNTVYSTLLTTVDIDSFRKNLFGFQELTGSSPNYSFFNDFYINMMEKIDYKYDIISGSTYLIPRKENKLIKILNAIKNLFLLKSFQKEK